MLSFLILITKFLVLYSKLNFRILLFLLVFAFSFGSTQPVFELSGPVGSQQVGPPQMVMDGAGANGQVFFNAILILQPPLPHSYPPSVIPDMNFSSKFNQLRGVFSVESAESLQKKC